jgi:hypothetical protein
MRERSLAWGAVFLFLLTICTPLSTVAGEQTTEERLMEEGLTVLALRNDTIDTNQDGDIDAVRVVVVLNSTSAQNDLIVKLRGLHKEREVLEVAEVSFSGQTNLSLVYDAWSKGEHRLRLDFFDEDGEFIASNPLPTFVLTPALRVPSVELTLHAAATVQTGEACEVERVFHDETGPRYGESGVRTFSGAPFSVLDAHGTLDCSSWPAGDYTLRETYRNGLGQTTEATLNFTITNRPAPQFSLSLVGHQNTTDLPCSASMSVEGIVDTSAWSKLWSIKGAPVEGANSTTLDCSQLPPGAYLITLEVTNDMMISSKQGVNLIRLPSSTDGGDEETLAPSTSLGDDTPTESVGWLSIGILALLVTFVVFLAFVRERTVEPLDLPSLGPAPQVLADGRPDAMGLPVVTDDQGVLWRQHPDGSLDWWDVEWRVWHGWDQ